MHKPQIVGIPRRYRRTVTFRRLRQTAVIACACTPIALLTACGSTSDTAVTTTVTAHAEPVTVTSTVTGSQTNTSSRTAPPTTTRTPTATRTSPTSSLTPAQRNAVGKARSYLQLSAFSRQGLIDQLKYESFAADDAAFAVDYISPNWTQQAVKKAAEYMKMSSFSEQGLVDQLVYEGFTQQQAAAGAASQF